MHDYYIVSWLSAFQCLELDAQVDILNISETVLGYKCFSRSYQCQRDKKKICLIRIKQ